MIFMNCTLHWITELESHWVWRLVYPVRQGEHPNTAFGLALALDYTRAPQVGCDKIQGLHRLDVIKYKGSTGSDRSSLLTSVFRWRRKTWSRGSLQMPQASTWKIGLKSCEKKSCEKKNILRTCLFLQELSNLLWTKRQWLPLPLYPGLLLAIISLLPQLRKLSIWFHFEFRLQLFHHQ